MNKIILLFILMAVAALLAGCTTSVQSDVVSGDVSVEIPDLSGVTDGVTQEAGNLYEDAKEYVSGALGGVI